MAARAILTSLTGSLLGRPLGIVCSVSLGVSRSGKSNSSVPARVLGTGHFAFVQIGCFACGYSKL